MAALGFPDHQIFREGEARRAGARRWRGEAERLCRHPTRQCQHFGDARRKCHFESTIADTENRLDELKHDVAVGPWRLVIGVLRNERLLAIGARRALADNLVGCADRAVRRIVESRDKPALASGDGGIGVLSQLVEIGAFLIP